VLERSDQARASVGHLLYNAIKEKKLDIKYFAAGLRNILEIIEDMAIDIPKIATYISQIVAQLIQNNDCSIDFLSIACDPIKDKSICADFISDLLHNASNRLGHNTVADIFKSSQLRINDFLKGVDNPNMFIKEKVNSNFYFSTKKTCIVSKSRLAFLFKK
jgi:translation initiation factor 4G